MLVSPKWQTMWMESQHCSKSIMSVNLPSQKTKRVLEDLRTNCCSSNKSVQLEALKCWGMWIKNQNNDDWRLNTVCFMAVRPLITKKMQPLHKDIDICKLKLSLMWALLVKVQNIMQLEGPQYILEVFLQSCLSWLSSTNGENCETEISVLIFQLLLSILQRNETVNDWDTEMFTPLTTDVLQVKKVFHCLADKFLNIFVHWRKVPNKIIFLKLWRCFLDHCELSCEHIPIPLWHKIFKLADQICSEKNEPVKERLAFLHSCSTTLKSALSSSKFIDFGNLLTTPCEALFKKLVELCTAECTEFCDLEMFVHSKEICQVLSVKSVAIGGFDLCISVLDVLEEFCLKDLFWGVWCGLVYCYKVHFMNVDKSNLSKVEMKFYRKLRGVAVNFELDRDALHKDCINEVERHIGYLNIKSLLPLTTSVGSGIEREMMDVEPMEVDARSRNLPEHPSLPGHDEPTGHVVPFVGKFLLPPYKKRQSLSLRTESLKVDLIKNILKDIQFNWKNSTLDFLFGFQFLKSLQPLHVSLNFKLSIDSKEELNLTLSCLKAKESSLVPECTPTKKSALVLYEGQQERNEEKKKKKRKVDEVEEEETVVSTPKTRSRRRAEEEKRREMESQKRKTRKSFEDLVQEIVRKNKERKTEKNSMRKSPVLTKSKKNKRKGGKTSDGKPHVRIETPSTVSNRKLRHSQREEVKSEKTKGKSFKTDGKLENYFQVISKKKSGNEVKKEKEKKKGKEKTKENTCCSAEKEEGERKGEIGWRQTSLKTMMNRRSKTGKVKPEIKTRSRTTEEKPKKDSKVTSSPLSKLSPFKEVFHDHEYAKIEPQDLETFERVLQAKKSLNKIEKAESKPIPLKQPESVPFCEEKMTEPELPLEQKSEIDLIEQLKPLELTENVEESKKNLEEPEPLMKVPDFEKVELKEESKPENSEEIPSLLETERFVVDEERLKESRLELQEKIPEIENFGNDVTPPKENPQGCKNTWKRGKKRVRTVKDERPTKRFKLDEGEPQEEKLPLEVTEKENLEERQTKVTSPSKREKSCGSESAPPKGDGSVKSNGKIASRALRMIALVPESTKGGQMQWEASSKVEVLKCKKAPNVDKNSRASKMLALLSENVSEVEEPDEVDEISSKKEVTTTPNMKTPVSSLKSPKSVKKRRSIRFDDAKNETVLYQTDTPPSQILQEKEKCRRVKSIAY